MKSLEEHPLFKFLKEQEDPYVGDYGEDKIVVDGYFRLCKFDEKFIEKKRVREVISDHCDMFRMPGTKEILLEELGLEK